MYILEFFIEFKKIYILADELDAVFLRIFINFKNVYGHLEWDFLSLDSDYHLVSLWVDDYFMSIFLEVGLKLSKKDIWID